MLGFHKISRLAALLLLLAGVAARAETTPTNSPWARIVMVGASASAGFMLSEPLGGTNTLKCRLSYFVDAALAAPHAPVRNLAHTMFFLNPEGVGQMQVTQTLKEQPTLVVGVDFLFWFCYGPGRTDAERLERFEHGLKILEAIPCPLVLGDIPDASYATNTGVISPAQVPSAEARAAANRRLKEWAAAHPQVTVMLLSDFMRSVMANQAIALHDRPLLPAGKTRALVQDDQLHPNPQGAAALALDLLDAFVSQHANIPVADIRWNPREVFQAGCAFAQAAGTNPVGQTAPAAAGGK